MLTTAHAISDADLLRTAEGLVRTAGHADAAEALTRLVGGDRAERTLARLATQERMAAGSHGALRSPCCTAARTVTMRRRTRRRPVVMPGTTPRP